MPRFTYHLAWLGLWLILPSLSPAQSRPNVLMIVADDMNGYGTAHEYPLAQTPYLDRLASQSVNFTQGVCNAPVCTPSRASFFSGLAPTTTGAYHNGVEYWQESEILNQLESLPECFQRNGYVTSGHGKIFHSRVEENRHAAMWDNQPYFGGFGPFPPKGEWQGGKKFRSVKAWTGPDADFPDIVNADKAVAFLKEEHDAPFFLYYGLWRPHTPYTAPARFFEPFKDLAMPWPYGMVEGDLEDVPPMGRLLVDSLEHIGFEPGEFDSTLFETFLRGYCATTLFADWNIGRVIEALDQSPYADNTIVIFFSDNGYHLGEKLHWQKTTLWDQADLVPYMIRMPHGQTMECPATVSLLDLYPTLVAACQLDPPDHELEGNNLLPLLQNPNQAWPHPSVTVVAEGHASVRDERYRYIVYPDGTAEAYDYVTDPHELYNLMGSPRGERIKARLEPFLPKRYAKDMGGRWEASRP
ncbi:MAG: sulfatase [Bacteroidota bacterium]